MPTLDIELPNGRREFRPDFLETPELMRSRDPDNLNVELVGGVQLSRHHIIAYNILRDRWNKAVELFFTKVVSIPDKSAADFLAAVAARADYLGLTPLEEGSPSVAQLIAEIAGKRITHGVDSQEADDYKPARDAFLALLTWCPANLVIGPQPTDGVGMPGRVDDPREHVEHFLLECVNSGPAKLGLRKMARAERTYRGWISGNKDLKDYFTGYKILFDSGVTVAQKVEDKYWKKVNFGDFYVAAAVGLVENGKTPVVWTRNKQRVVLRQVRGRDAAMTKRTPKPTQHPATQPGIVDVVPNDDLPIEIGGRKIELVLVATWSDGSGCAEHGVWVEQVTVQNVLDWAGKEWQVTVNLPDLVRDLTISGVSIHTIRGSGWEFWQAAFSARTLIDEWDVEITPRVEWVAGNEVTVGASMAFSSATETDGPIFYFDGDFNKSGKDWTLDAELVVTDPLGVEDLATLVELSTQDVPTELRALFPAVTGARLQYNHTPEGSGLALSLSTEHVECVLASTVGDTSETTRMESIPDPIAVTD
ncbi:hypothetical protein [Saccharothrix xinjiangensis]|uniref:Uncharacterized protein n=1 Tax=Saccharothrix xinjiangensis TaxID=204798 RepID=A0ABV9XZR8_9PSEU